MHMLIYLHARYRKAEVQRLAHRWCAGELDEVCARCSQPSVLTDEPALSNHAVTLPACRATAGSSQRSYQAKFS